MPRVFNEITGKQLDLPEQPRRIISFSPAVTETLFLLGLGDRIIGVTPFCVRPPEAREKRRIGSYNTVRLDALKELKPDLLFTVTGYQRSFALKLAEDLPVFPVELPVSVSSIVDMVVKVGLAAGAAQAARKLERKLIENLANLRPASSKPSVYVEIDLGGPVSFGAYSYITDGIRLLNATNIFEDVNVEWLTPDFNGVVEADPEVIFYEAKMFTKFEKGDLHALIGKRGWEGLRAVRTGNLWLTPRPFDFLAHHGPSFITEVLPWVAEKMSRLA
ncbi:MAG: ABC transporter substrate-binding protein [Thaumarchaeota archaeon]|nr:ABC transporter substrate-binding protein [Nitrososphaerota archaeon]